MLKGINGCGPSAIRQIVSESNSISPSLLSDSELLEFVNSCVASGIKRSRLNLLSKSDFSKAVDNADRILDKSVRLGIGAVSYLDPSFPIQLTNTVNEDGKPNVPLILFYKGNLSVTQRKGIAIIGTREPTKEGISVSEFLGEKLAEAGYNIVSGLATGCDTAGHRGALKAIEGRTTAFLAHGLDSIYPPENEPLAESIIYNGGLLLSEYPVGESVNNYYLVARDRLEAALSEATIVIQTGIHGGTNHAANTTLVSGKPLFCVKFDSDALMQSEVVKGNTALVLRGAKYITSGDYISQITSSIGGPLFNKKEEFPEQDPEQELLLFP